MFSSAFRHHRSKAVGLINRSCITPRGQRSPQWTTRWMSSISGGPRWQEVAADIKMEEETLTNYRAERYYPVRIGDVFRYKYQIVAKLGFGMYSTVWLCRDLETQIYLTMKVSTSDSRNSASDRELATTRHLNALPFNGPGAAGDFLRLVLDNFEVPGPGGTHTFMLFKPLGPSLATHLHRFQSVNLTFDPTLLRLFMYPILVGLDLLHQAEVVHTDISPNNILVELTNESFCSAMESYEMRFPSARKTLAGRTIYESAIMPITYGRTFICDFGSAHLGKKGTEDIMPDMYRAPEVILGMGWDDKVDIWSIGMMIWSLSQGHGLFRPAKNGIFDNEQHLSEMVSVMGNPPLDFLMKNHHTLNYWNKQGQWIAQTKVCGQTLEQRETHFAGTGREKTLLLDFMRQILRWLPEERPSAKNLLKHEFMSGAFDHVNESQAIKHDTQAC